MQNQSNRLVAIFFFCEDKCKHARKLAKDQNDLSANITPVSTKNKNKRFKTGYVQ